MKDLQALGIRHHDGHLEVLDQRKLPDEEAWLTVNSTEDMVEIIYQLSVRGAPLIGVAAALSLAHAAERGVEGARLEEAAKALRAARPTAVNLMWAVDRMVLSVPEDDRSVEYLVSTAEEIFEGDVELCRRIGEHGAALVQDGDRILTHCNAGALATAGIGTAIGVIQTAHDQGKKIEVWVDETRPLLQGGRLTAWELERLGIPHRIICDNMAPMLMARGEVDRVFVGADRIAMNGDFANKIGTYGVAVAAERHGVPFYTAAPWTTVDQKCANGAGIPIEERKPEEVRGVSGSFGEVRWSPANSPVFNPAFDVTPVELVSGIVLETGVQTREALIENGLQLEQAAV